MCLAGSRATKETWVLREGSPYPLGVRFIESDQAFNFAIYSKHAERVTLLLFSQADVQTPLLRFEFDYLHNKSGSVWHCRSPAVQAVDAFYYGY